MLILLTRQRSIRALNLFIVFFTILVIFQVSYVFKKGMYSVSQEGLHSSSNGFFNSKFVMEDLEGREAPTRPHHVPYQSRKRREMKGLGVKHLSGLNFTAIVASGRKSGILKSATDAVELGRKLWRELELNEGNRSEGGFGGISSVDSNSTDKVECPYSISISGDAFGGNGSVAVLPCGLTLGSHITVIGKPRAAHVETNPQISLLKEGQFVMVSQFMVELQGLKTVEGEDPPRIFHFNPRLKGDWSGKPAIEHNTCYRMQWGTSQRCQGWRSRADEETGEWKELLC